MSKTATRYYNSGSAVYYIDGDCHVYTDIPYELVSGADYDALKSDHAKLHHALRTIVRLRDHASSHDLGDIAQAAIDGIIV